MFKTNKKPCQTLILVLFKKKLLGVEKQVNNMLKNRFHIDRT